MRVVSQKRDYSFDFDSTIFWIQYDTIYAKHENNSIPIGQYKSDERAAEVFDDMHKAYSCMPLIFKNVQLSEDFEQKFKEMNRQAIITVLPDEPAKIEQINNSVYYMPEV